MPSRAICGVALVISAFMNDIHWSSTHIGSSPRVPGKSGRHVHPFVPARSVTIFPPSVAGQSMMVAFAEMERGAAFIALAIFGALVRFACATARSPDPDQTNISTRRPRARCIRSSLKRVSADDEGRGIARRRVVLVYSKFLRARRQESNIRQGPGLSSVCHRRVSEGNRTSGGPRYRYHVP